MHPLKTGSVLQFGSCNPAESNLTALSVIPGKKTQTHLEQEGKKESAVIRDSNHHVVGENPTKFITTSL